MSIFRNLNKVVSSQLFSKPNSLVYTSCFRPVFLELGKDESIEYVHSSKALLKTIDELQSHKSGAHSKLVESELTFLNQQLKNYGKKIELFVHKRGLLTGEGIGNIYYGADRLGFSAEWLENNVHSEIPRKCQYMTRANLIDTLEGLKKYHPSSPYISQVQQELAGRPAEKLEYVSHQVNEISKFEYDQNIVSNNPLVYVVRKGGNSIVFHVLSALIRFYSGGRYALHSE